MEESNLEKNPNLNDDTINNNVIEDSINGVNGASGTDGMGTVANNVNIGNALNSGDDSAININVDGVSINFNISKLLQQFLSNN